MTKKAFWWLIADLILAGIITAACVLLRNCIVAWLGNINYYILLAIKIVFTGAYIVADGFILIYYLFFLWSERKWTNIKRRFGF